MSRIIVFGGGGSIGSELVRQLAPDNSVHVLDNNETAMFDLVEEQRLKGYDVTGRVGDIRNQRTVDEAFESFSPDLVFLAAALKHVTPSEQFPRQVALTNIIGLLNVVEAAKRNGSKLVFISTDKVVNASSIMGVSKRFGELAVRNAGFNSVRFGNVLGSRGSVITIWEKQIAEGRDLTITDKRMERYVMTISQAVELVIEASKMPQDGRIIILDMGPRVKIIDLANDLIKASGKELGIREIGIRPGEELSEDLMTASESARARREEKFYII